MLKLILILLGIALVHSRGNRMALNATSIKQGKVFSLFNIVQFPNDACTSTSSQFPKGTCLSSGECSSKSGSAMGNCASGFGVCCVFSSSTCGSTISENCTYITNPGFPNTYSTTGSCEWTVEKSSSDICQLRLDFTALVLNIMPTNTINKNSNYGCCGSSCATIIIVATIATDSFTAAGQTGVNPPVICGINSGYHMYLEMGTLSTDTSTLSFYLGNTGSRQWNIKVQQISCTANWRVPAGCVQYYTGLSGNVKSYGHASGQLLQAQNYNNCIRQEEGYCSMVWREAGQSSLSGTSPISPDPFSFPDAPATTGTGLNSLCPNAHVFISAANLGEPAIATYLGNTFCGEALNCEACVTAVISPAGRPLPATTESFYLGVFSDSGHLATNPTDNAATGFNLRYVQQACN